VKERRSTDGALEAINDPRRFKTVGRPRPVMVPATLPIVPVPAVVITVVPIDVPVTHHGIQHELRIVVDDESVRVAIAVRVIMDGPRTGWIARDPDTLRLHGGAATKEHQPDRDRCQNHRQGTSVHRCTPVCCPLSDQIRCPVNRKRRPEAPSRDSGHRFLLTFHSPDVC